MPLYITSAAGTSITLTELLASRDARQARQQEWLARYPVTLVSFTVISPGPVKDSALTRRIFNHGIRALRVLAQEAGWEIIKQLAQPLVTGPEGLLAINAPAHNVKQTLIELEQSHPLGRLWDADVFTPEGILLSRRDFSRSPRTCLLCSREAILCSREQTHALSELIANMEERLDNVDDLIRN